MTPVTIFEANLAKLWLEGHQRSHHHHHLYHLVQILVVWFSAGILACWLLNSLRFPQLARRSAGVRRRYVQNVTCKLHNEVFPNWTYYMTKWIPCIPYRNHTYWAYCHRMQGISFTSPPHSLCILPQCCWSGLLQNVLHVPTSPSASCHVLVGNRKCSHT